MIDLSSNINPFYPTKNMYLYLHRNLNKIKKYSNKHIDVSDDGVLNKYHLPLAPWYMTDRVTDSIKSFLRACKSGFCMLH